ncbi:MAG TPA: AAC(3) family N-acetyltransferase [Candidatus Anaerobiospirillum pullistercoris]|uniref:Aminoglycoside N(3)-acetyltransferase n=1 Tax=Candidatus Anaerobiospirillum pullistercoris TaxID=2838452 RepID=A0A9D1WC62_9GAMM|nr:AAC(3) family N-acetyltransferase [Candidatus Anaerobiospirillum pullistercoris]
MSTDFTYTEPIFSFDNQNFGFNDLCCVLQEVGINAGDDICVHTSLMRLGKILVKPNIFLGTFVAALREVIGPDATLIMPTFTYSYCKQQVYDVRNSPSTMGILTEYYRKLPECQRTLDPIFSFAVSGKHADDYLHAKATSCFGSNCLYDLLTKRNGKIVILGDKRTGYTYDHYVEECVQVDYRYYKTFSGTTIDANDNEFQSSINYYVRCLDRPSTFALSGTHYVLEHNHLSKAMSLGGGEILAFECAPFKEALSELLQHDAHRWLI